MIKTTLSTKGTSGSKSKWMTPSARIQTKVYLSSLARGLLDRMTRVKERCSSNRMLTNRRSLFTIIWRLSGRTPRMCSWSDTRATGQKIELVALNGKTSKRLSSSGRACLNIWKKRSNDSETSILRRVQNSASLSSCSKRRMSLRICALSKTYNKTWPFKRASSEGRIQL